MIMKRLSKVKTSLNVISHVYQESMSTVTTVLKTLLLAMIELQIRTRIHLRTMSVTVLTDTPLLLLLTGLHSLSTQSALMETNVLVLLTTVISTLIVKIEIWRSMKENSNVFVKMATHTTQRPNHDSTTVSTLRNVVHQISTVVIQ